LKTYSYTIDRTKKFQIVYRDKIISKHVDFYLAQLAVEKHLKSGKIGNEYEIQHIGEHKK